MKKLKKTALCKNYRILQKDYAYKHSLLFCFMINIKVLLLSILGIIFIILTFILNPWFIVGAVIIMLINQRELMKMQKQTKTI